MRKLKCSDDRSLSYLELMNWVALPTVLGLMGFERGPLTVERLTGITQMVHSTTQGESPVFANCSWGRHSPSSITLTAT